MPAGTDNSEASASGTQNSTERDWHLEYAKMVKESILPLSELNELPGQEDYSAPPCFFYGTLMALPVLYRVVYGNPEPSELVTAHLKIRPAILKDHRRRFVRFCDYPGVTPHPGSQVAGTMVTGLTKRDMRNLERFEGFEYTLTPINVQVLTSRTPGPPGLNGEPSWENEVWEEMEAMTYMYTAGERHLEDREWRFIDYMENHMLGWSGLQVTSASKQIYDSLGYWKDAVVNLDSK
ncbi:hypothetical protein BDZ91DRAFT_417570 [Kalaharituber pfeilii]|nr:hypothetical protein BDZ91DRAFT_417570 [Kalaharituber pfeilii]